MKRLPARLLVVAASLPPETTGGAVVLDRMMRGVDPRDYYLVSFDPPMAPGLGDPLPADGLRIRRPWRDHDSANPGYPLGGVRALRLVIAEAVGRAHQLLLMAKRESCAALLVTTGSAPDLMAGAIAARVGGLPLIVWMFDHWRHQNHDLLGIATAGKLIEGAIVRAAQAVIVMNERLAEELRDEHGCESVVIPHPVDPDLAADSDPAPPWPADPDAPTIVYTGQVYAAQLDAVARLVDALEAPALSRWRLHIHGSVSPLPAWLRQTRVVSHSASDAATIRAVQRRADLLFLPLGFASPYPALINTSWPTKANEYLSSGRPILVHAAPDSYLAAVARRENFAEVVDQPAPEMIADAIVRLTHDPQLRQIRVTQATAMLARFSMQEARERFIALLAGVVARA